MTYLHPGQIVAFSTLRKETSRMGGTNPLGYTQLSGYFNITDIF